MTSKPEPDDSLSLPASDVSIDQDGRVVLNAPDIAAAVRSQLDAISEDAAEKVITINVWKCSSS